MSKNIGRNELDNLYNDESWDDELQYDKIKFRRDRDEEIIQKKKVLRNRQQKRRQKRNSRWEE